MLGRRGKNRIDFFRRKIVAPLFCELLCWHVVVKPRAIGLQTRTVVASDRFEISPALETSGPGFGHQARQAEESNSLSPHQVFNVRQFMGEDRLHALDRSSRVLHSAFTRMKYRIFMPAAKRAALNEVRK